jgi:hypothetical protein
MGPAKIDDLSMLIGADIRTHLAFGDEPRFRGQCIINRDRKWRIQPPSQLLINLVLRQSVRYTIKELGISAQSI